MSETSVFATYPSLQDRVVVVTGGGSGIGASIVEHFAEQGSKVTFLDIAVDVSNELTARLSGKSRNAPLFLPCDLTDIGALRSAFLQIEERLGPVGALVNNAANDERHAFLDVTPEYWNRALSVNLTHQFFAMQAVVPGMKAAGGGSIINMSSIAWKIPSTGLPAYVTAKAAIVGLTRTMSHELGSAAIRVNAILPGSIVTERQRATVLTPEYEAEVMSSQSLPRALLPEDVARLTLFLAADDSSAITNQSYIVDGGWV